jgi:radical SAM superfamily enzyme YgiQ (UPF0313 family)
MGATHVPMMDDLFVADKKRFIDILEKIDKRELRKQFNFDFMVQVRANLVDDEMCRLLKAFPVRGGHFGIESGSNRILKLIGKGITVEKNQAALDLLHSYGIPGMPSFIIGYPSETEEEMKATLDFIIRNGRAGKMNIWSGINILTPFPGTKVWDDAVQQGKIDVGNFDWSRLGAWSSYTQQNFRSFDDWVVARRQNNSIYLNEDVVPQERLYELLKEHDNEVRKG